MQSTRIPARSLLCPARPSPRDWSLPPWPLLLARAPRPEPDRNEGTPIRPPKGERTRAPTPQPLFFSRILALGNPPRRALSGVRAPAGKIRVGYFHAPYASHSSPLRGRQDQASSLSSLSTFICQLLTSI